MNSPSNPRRRKLLLGVASAAIGSAVALATAQPQPRIINVIAERYRFTPNKITLKKGEAVILAFTTRDVPMGFSAPSLKLRTNILPDLPSELQFTPDKTGNFAFSCDILWNRP